MKDCKTPCRKASIIVSIPSFLFVSRPDLIGSDSECQNSDVPSVEARKGVDFSFCMVGWPVVRVIGAGAIRQADRRR